MPTRLRLAFALLALSLAPSLPALASDADPGRSSAYVQAPELAPGAWGSAPVYGQLSPDGGFVLRVPVSAVQTDNAFHSMLVKQVLRGTITLAADRPRLAYRHGITSRLRALATLYVAGRASRVPLSYRTITRPDGTLLRSYLSLPLAAYGIYKPGGGSPGSVRVAIEAFGPGQL